MGEHGNIIDKSDDWYTPAYVFDALGCRFDLDVAAPVDALLFCTPKIKFERPDGSIGEQPGSGTVLMAKGAVAVGALANAARAGLGFSIPIINPAQRAA